MLYSFHDQEREESAEALSFFGSRTPSFLKIAENRKATTPFSLRSTEIFFRAAVLGVQKVAEIRRAIISLFLQLFHSLIRKCQDYVQRTTHQKSFCRGGQRRVARLGRKKLAEQTTLKQI